METTVKLGVGVGLTGVVTVIVPVFMSPVNLPPDISTAGVPFKEKYLSLPVTYVGNCWLPEYIRSNWTPTCSETVICGSLENIIYESFETLGLTGTERFHLTLGRPCHSVGAGAPCIVCASVINVTVQSPGDVSS